MPQRDEAGPVPGLLIDGERLAIETRFGVDSERVVRDHAISHALAAIASLGTEDVVFFGGTALSRTHLTDLRLSEDIDEAAALFGRLGTYTSASNVPFTRVPSDAEWEAALGYQGIVRVGPADAACAVRDALRAP